MKVRVEGFNKGFLGRSLDRSWALGTDKLDRLTRVVALERDESASECRSRPSPSRKTVKDNDTIGIRLQKVAHHVDAVDHLIEIGSSVIGPIKQLVTHVKAFKELLRRTVLFFDA